MLGFQIYRHWFLTLHLFYGGYILYMKRKSIYLEIMITCRVPSRQGIAVWVHVTLVCTQGGILSDSMHLIRSR